MKNPTKENREAKRLRDMSYEDLCKAASEAFRPKMKSQRLQAAKQAS